MARGGRRKLSLTLDLDQVAWLEAEAAAASASLSTVARQAIRFAMEAKTMPSATPAPPTEAPARTPSVPPFDASGPAMGGGEV